MAGTIVAGTLSDGTYSGSVTDTVRGACKAWVNFNGTGTVAIREAYNVSSITDLGTGLYVVNFITAMLDRNYSALVSASVQNNFTSVKVTNGDSNWTTSGIYFDIWNSTNSLADSYFNSVAIFR